MMIYELTYGGYRLGTFPSEAEAVRRAGYLPKGRYTVREWERNGEFAVRRAGYLPKGRYTVREWERNGEFSTFDPSTNKHYDFNN